MNIGVDVGGSHVGVGLVNEKGEILLKCEKDYNKNEKDMSQIVIDTILQLISEVITKSKIGRQEIGKIGLAFPGTVSNGTVVKAENLGIENLKIKDILENYYDCDIKLENDAKCAAIAEKKLGSLRQYEDSLFLNVGTGIGGASFLGGNLLKPKRYSGFEVGHMIIQKDGIQCNCGRKGCFESYCSMKRLKEQIAREFKLNTIDGKKIREFIEQNSDNQKLEKILDTYIENLNIGISNLINIFEPQVISIGGSFAHYKKILLKRLERKMVEKQELYNKGDIPKIIIAELKNDAGIIGAAI